MVLRKQSSLHTLPSTLKCLILARDRISRGETCRKIGIFTLFIKTEVVCVNCGATATSASKRAAT